MNPADLDDVAQVAAADLELVNSEGQLVTTADDSLLPSWKETFAGVEGSTRRTSTFFVLGWLVATAVRTAMFHPLLAGSYLIKELAPVEREGVRWGWILAVRAWDLALGTWIWKRVNGLTRSDGATFGALLAAVSRSSLYFFEHAYFLLKTETVGAVFAIDILSFAAAFSFVKTLLPHSVESRPAFSAWTRLQQNPELVINLLLALGIATFTGATGAYITERVGGQAFIKAHTFDLSVPAVYAADTMTTAQMMAHPVVAVPALRSFLEPQSMPRHLLHSAGIALTTIPLVSILPTLTPLGIAITVFALVAPSTSFLFWDVLPVYPAGAAATGTFLGLRAAVMAGLVAWVLEELRENRRMRHVDIVVVDEDTNVVAIVDADVEIADGALKQRKGILKSHPVVEDDE